MPSPKSNSLYQNLIYLYRSLSKKRQRQLRLTAFLVIISAISETVSLGAALPFLGALSNASKLLKNPNLEPVFNFLQVNTAEQLITWLAILFAITVIIANGLRLLSIRIQLYLAAAMGSDLSYQVYHRALMQPYSFHISRNTNELISSLVSDIGIVSGISIPSVLSLLSNGVLVIAIALTLLFINPQVALAVSGTLGLVYLLLLNFSKKALARNSYQIANQKQLMLKSLQEGLGGIRDILLDGSQAFFERLYYEAERPFRKARASNVFIGVMPRFWIETAAMVSIALLAVIMAHHSDSITQIIPMLGALALGANRLLPALQSCFISISHIRGNTASLNKVILALRRPIDSNILLGNPVALSLQDELTFRSIWFRYNQSTPWVLKDLSLTIKANTTVGFVGSTGSGKSTIADLILGLLHPERGQVLVDGVPLKGDRIRSWQCGIAHVPQSIFLSDGTITENIAFGVSPKDIDHERVRKAARLAQIDTFIESREKGYEAIVGERGVKLSGGQRQRIGIARALYKQASVVVFDEATSALDNETEKEVMSAIESLSHQLTIILIAHRLSTLEKCDQIFQLEQGRLLSKGSYADLCSKGTLTEPCDGM